MREELRLHYACPVPVGHHVRVRWYLVPRGGAGPLIQRPKEPVVEDLDSGIRYAPGWSLHSEADEEVRELSQTQRHIPESFRIQRTLVGRVVGCTVVRMKANARHPVQTRLEIEPELPGAPYR